MVLQSMFFYTAFLLSVVLIVLSLTTGDFIASFVKKKIDKIY